jgi:FkbM family methyltransferase
MSRLAKWSRPLVSLVGRVSRYSPRGKQLLAKLLAGRSGDREFRYRDRRGLLRRADLADHLELAGFLGISTLAIPAEVRKAVRAGDLVVDVGANVGLVAGELCHLVGPTGEVWAFEPLPRNVARLQELKDDNGLDQLRVFPYALGADPARLSLRLPTGGQSGWGSFTKDWDIGDTVEVEVRRLDDVLGSRPVRLLKIDVEGYEEQVLSGAEQILRSSRPIIICEIADRWLRAAGSSENALIARFTDLGYRVATRRPAGMPWWDAVLLPE